MPLEHIQPQQHVHGLLFKDGEGTRQEIPFDLDLS